MPKITPNLLTDTLNVVALAREMALSRGGEAQAERLTPVVDGLRSAANAARTQPPAQTQPPATPLTGALAGSDFQALLAASQAAQAGPTAARFASAPTDRGQVAAAMAAGGMGEIDIARHLGATREEVRLMLSVSPTEARR
jgi:hypothetical protein